jgi:subtilisin family serine protease
MNRNRRLVNPPDATLPSTIQSDRELRCDGIGGQSPFSQLWAPSRNRLWRAVLVAGLVGFWLHAAAAVEPENPKTTCAEVARAGVKAGGIAFRLTTPEELQALLGKPDREKKGTDGDLETLELQFSEVTALFGRPAELRGPFSLYQIQVAGETVDIGRERTIVLRTESDLKKMDAFWGLCGNSLARLDLRNLGETLSRLSFDSQTMWPQADKLPEGFSPQRLLEEGKNPGLGVRKLQEAGIDGRGIGIAIIDQPLLREHKEYQDRIVKYEALEGAGTQPSMHGPSVTSIAVGKKCGVAPGAVVHYFAVPTWKWLQNEPWAELLERIVELNRQLQDTPKIKVVSISLGAFSERPNYARWKQALQRAEEAQVLVVTCDPGFLRLGTLKRIESRPDLGPLDYTRGWFGHPWAALYVPAANRTLASFKGPELYTYDRLGGMSWTVPYLAGVAALGFQIDPTLKPAEVVRLWRETACKTPIGPIIDPTAFVEAIRKRTAHGSKS